MALTLVKEDGTGKTNANSYANASDGDSYFEAHLYAEAWTNATTSAKEVALVMATRLIDSMCQFSGRRAHDTQALQWPRAECPDPDRGQKTSTVVAPVSDTFVPENLVPKQISDATCEMARELLILDRTAAPPGEGVDEVQTAESSSSDDGTNKTSSSTSSTTKYDKGDKRPIISSVAQAMLSKFGSMVRASGGSVKLVRT
jgi:hypothetical protein